VSLRDNIRQIRRYPMDTTEQSAKQSRARRRPSWPRILSRRLPSGNWSYKIDVLVDGNRIYESFKTESEAITRAWEMFQDRQATGKAGFGLSMPQRVEAANCFKVLAGYPGAKLADAVDYYVNRKLQFRESPSVAEGVEKIVAEITGRRSKRTVDNVRCRWRKFAEDFGGRAFTEIEADEITAWLDRVAHHPETRHNYRRQVVALFKLAIGKKWCQDNPAMDSRKDDRMPPEPHVFKVDELARVLEHADEYGLLPYIVLGTFCGIRVSELVRLDWSKVDYQERAVTVEAATTKTKTRRVVSLNDTAAAWLQPHIKRSGLVVGAEALRERLFDLRKSAGMKRWPTNIMRHSFGSYALAQWQDVAKVSYQMGNAPAVCRRHYEQVVKKSEATRFWALRPSGDAAGKIVPMQQAVK
jgi:integrase